ncbi:chorismate-binding protein [Thiorhodovibrio frisius]|uniref:Anthranilate/para-aminobenzoate synthase component I n=1 Tax=Thiorhodovibrio frisius TaxID=631362 RepID=H8Z4U0_9GAMM|nr:bifunctional anthranilate synthase component I family protein/class IV aminotransferase [Thiorhodovibrio frisius]EIC20347.1 anthranilate/para-aminobenzoate synthase component I [Thiorhodovibrio frisius]WPL21085.1 Para-aminobenzoate synthase component 1 [Thiorhodovibrio frisius]
MAQALTAVLSDSQFQSHPQPPCALIHDPDSAGWLQLQDPAWVLRTDEPSQVRALLTEGLNRPETPASLCCLAYEAGAAFDPCLCGQESGTQPLLWMAGFQTLTRLESDRLLAEGDSSGDAEPRDPLFGPWQPEMSEQDYARAFAAVKAHLAAGNAYQINLTQRYRAQLLEPASHAGLRRLFIRLAARHRSPHAAFIDTGDFALLSLSPETFFERDQHRVRCRPMKGTAARGETEAADRQAARYLQTSEKERAENRMIVDMVRNDLGRVARIGRVRVPRLFALEHYPTVHQMISEVTAETDVPDAALLAALFPSASITGAPKVAATAIIAELEASPRGFYTGTIGTRLATGRAFWSVAIRTLVVHRRSGMAEYGSGGGIVWDSQMDRELAELRLKACLLADTAARFELLETLLLQSDGRVFLENRHLQRLHASAQVFGFPCDQALIKHRLEAAVDATRQETPEARILRLVLTSTGAVSVSVSALRERPMPKPLRVRLAERPIDSRDILLRHKTTDRRVYQLAAGQTPSTGEEVFLFNERHELTEGTFTNIVLELDGCWYTPPVSAGLLPGCYRAELLATGRISERTLTPADLERASSVWAINSVRGMMPCLIATSSSPGKGFRQQSGKNPL